MSQTDNANDDEYRDAVQRIMKRRRVAAKEPHLAMLRSLADADGGWRWADNIDWSDVITLCSTLICSPGMSCHNPMGRTATGSDSRNSAVNSIVKSRRR